VADRYFYNARGDVIPSTCVLGAIQHYKGTNLDGNCIYHTVYFDIEHQKHITYDTVKVRGIHRYILGSGRERAYNSGDIVRWDSCECVTWQDALRKYTRDLIQSI
jgi:hypothetical protein